MRSDAVSQLHCPHCSNGIPTDAVYCRACGWEVRQPCPHCNERRLLALMDPVASAWCEWCHRYTFACNQCGRWLKTDSLTCHDPSCNGIIAPITPQYVGRCSDGSGFVEAWNPAIDLASGSKGIAGEKVVLDMTLLLATFWAHHHFYVWADSKLQEHDFTELMSHEIPKRVIAQGQSIAAPGPASSSERVALVSDRVVLATHEGYRTISLREGDSISAVLVPGRPIAQVGWLDRWCGWINTTGGQKFYAGCYVGNQIISKEIVANAHMLAGGARITANGNLATWPGRDGNIYCFDFSKWDSDPKIELFCTIPSASSNPVTKVLLTLRDSGLWLIVERAAGPHNIEIYRSDSLSGRVPKLIAGPISGPLRSIHAVGDELIVIAKEIFRVDPIDTTIHPLTLPFAITDIHDSIAVPWPGEPLRLMITTGRPSHNTAQSGKLFFIDPWKGTVLEYPVSLDVESRPFPVSNLLFTVSERALTVLSPL